MDRVGTCSICNIGGRQVTTFMLLGKPVTHCVDQWQCIINWCDTEATETDVRRAYLVICVLGSSKQQT